MVVPREVCSTIVVGSRGFGHETTAENAAEDEELSLKWDVLSIFEGIHSTSHLTRVLLEYLSARKEQF